MNTSEVLNRAADHIDAFGLWKGRAFPGGNASCDTAPACTVGAITLAEINASVPVGSVLAVLAAYLGVGRHQVWVWSDAPERTAEDVVAALRATAAVEALKEATARGPLHTGPTVRIPSPPAPAGVA